MLVRSKRRVPLWLIVVFAILFMFGFLTWAGAGSSLPMIGLLFGSLSLAVPLIFGSLAGVIGERAGIVNIAIEGQLLAGAFTAAVVASVTGQPWFGLIAAMVAGMLVGMVLAVFSIKYFVDQVIVGVVLNVLVVGLTSFFFSQVLAPNAASLNTPPRFDRLPIPVLGDIPIIGPVFFQQTVIVYLMYVAVALVYIGLFHTKWGLRVRAVGEHPQAADTVGIKVNRTRFWNVALAGAIAGLGGTFFTIGSGIAFNKEMTAGAGFIALAAVIFGQWDPIKATLGGAAVRLRVEPAEHPVGHRFPGAERVHAHAAVPRHDLRRRRPRREVPRTGGRRQALHQILTGRPGHGASVAPIA